MILKGLQEHIENEKRGEFIYPLYETYCFSNIPSAILSLLGIHQRSSPLLELLTEAKVNPSSPKKVVLLLIDGFGFNQWMSYAEKYEFFNKLTKRGIVAPITTIFPSTTSATITTVNSGLTPQEHGLPEWVVYFEEIDRIITTLPFVPIGESGIDNLLDAGVNPKILFNGKSIYQTLGKSNIPSFTFLRDSYAKSSYSKLVYKGSITIPFVNSSDLLVNLREKIAEVPPPAYFYVYWDAIDSIEHIYGPHTEQYFAELNGFSYLLQEEFLGKMDERSAKETLILATADHGQINVSPKETIYLSRHPRIVRSLQLSASGKKILPWGSPRDVFLQIKEEKLEEVFEFLTELLDGKATVVKSQDAIKDGLFGLGRLHKRFRSRVGNILILPHKNYTVWYEHIKGKKFRLLGMHGGLSPDEMLVPFAAANLYDLL
jgi:predicted AlkP superfamily pyrophosphatase or phosphodiesterase